jgi:hypothetical protein
VRRRSLPDFPSRCSGFIFCEFFSNLGRTGCRRGRTPERPLRQPSKVWLISQTVFVSGLVDGNSAPIRLCRKAGLTHLACALHRLQRVQSAWSLRVRKFPTAAPSVLAPAGRALQGHKLVSQSVALCGRLRLRWRAARFRFVIKRPERNARGKDSEASNMPAEIARPFAELRWTAPSRERLGRKRR